MKTLITRVLISLAVLSFATFSQAQDLRHINCIAYDYYGTQIRKIQIDTRKYMCADFDSCHQCVLEEQGSSDGETYTCGGYGEGTGVKYVYEKSPTNGHLIRMFVNIGGERKLFDIAACRYSN